MAANGYILVVEDDPALSELFVTALSRDGRTVLTVKDAREAASEARRMPIDLLIVDASLGSGNPYSVIAEARQRTGGLPPVILIGTREDFYAISSLTDEDDAYLAKPVSAEDLIACAERLLESHRQPTVFSEGGLRFDTASGIVSRDGEQLHLSPLESRFLLILFSNRGSILTPHRLIEESWDVCGDIMNPDTVDACIASLREQVEDDPEHPRIIRTARGLGYTIEA